MEEQDINQLPEPIKESPAIPFRDPQLDAYPLTILKRNVFKQISGFIQGDNAATATNYGLFFVVERPYEIISITCRFKTKGTDASAVTLTVEKCSSGTAPDSGVVLLATAFDLKGANNTSQYGTLTNTKQNLFLKKGDALLLKDSGILTAVSDVCVTVIMRER